MGTTGREYDRNGNRLNWWEPSDDREFRNRTECLKDQYASFTIKHRGREYSLDRNDAQGENIADNGAAKVAYRSLLEWDSPRKEECIPGISLNAKQLYWLGFALDWCTMGDGYRRYSNYRSFSVPQCLGPDIPPHPGGSTWLWRTSRSLPET